MVPRCVSRGAHRARRQEGLVVEDAGAAAPSVLDLLSDDAAGFDSALPPSFDDVFDVESFAVDSFAVDSFEPDSDDAPFFRASEG